MPGLTGDDDDSDSERGGDAFQDCMPELVSSSDDEDGDGGGSRDGDGDGDGDGMDVD